MQYVKKPKMVVLDVKVAVRLLKVKKRTHVTRANDDSTGGAGDVHSRLDKKLRKPIAKSKSWHEEAEIEAILRRAERDARNAAAYKRLFITK